MPSYFRCKRSWKELWCTIGFALIITEQGNWRPRISDFGRQRIVTLAIVVFTKCTYNICAIRETFYSILVVPRSFHKTWIKFHFDVENNKSTTKNVSIQSITRWQSETTFCVMIDRGYTQAVRFKTIRVHDMMPPIAIGEHICPQNGIFK